MRRTVSQSLQADYKGYVAGALLSKVSCFELVWWIPIHSEGGPVSFRLILRDSVTEDQVYVKEYTVEGDAVIHGSIEIGKVCHPLELLIATNDPSQVLSVSPSPYNNLTLISL